MSSFSRSTAVATAIQSVSKPAHEASHGAETPDDGTIHSADPSTTPADAHAAAGEVDFDTAIAEVLMTLATGDTAAADARPGAEHENVAALAHDEGDDDPALGDEAMSGRAEDEPGEEDDPGDEDEAPDPEAVLAAEAATFRLLGELERLWHRAA